VGHVLFACELPIPPSVNNLFVNAAKGRGRYPSQQYTRWKKEAALSLIGLPLPTKPIAAPVAIEISIATKCRNDLDNSAKALIDFLVQQGILLNDNRTIVRRITLQWDASVKTSKVTVLRHET
jgi:Holliday junction resolvase RusA-like endonuclease